MSTQKSPRVQSPSAEHKIISTLQRLCGPIDTSLFDCGIGDDCAVKKGSSSRQLFSADNSVEGVHFSLEYMTLEAVGYRAMITNISDIAAMGGVPEAVLLQIVVPQRSSSAELFELYKGIGAACKEYQVSVIGGDLSRGSEWVIAITIMGSELEQHPPRSLMRSGAQVGDVIWVSGTPGRSALGLEGLQKNQVEGYEPHLKAHVTPEAQVALGHLLVQDPLVHSAIDISDGVAKEVVTLCYESGVGAELAVPKRVLAPLESSAYAKKPLHYFLHGGEDYELLFTAAPAFKAPRSHSCTVIGTVVQAENGCVVVHEEQSIELVSGGWDHFS